MGVGVLIGHNNKTTSTRRGAAAPQVITVQGGGAAGTTPTSRDDAAQAEQEVEGARRRRPRVAAPPKAVQKKATEAAGKVLGNRAQPGASRPSRRVRGAPAAGRLLRAASSPGTSSGREGSRLDHARCPDVRRQPPADAPPPDATAARAAAFAPPTESQIVDLERRRDQLKARVAELQWDLGGLVYEMAIRDRIRVDVLVKRAAVLQNADAELGEIERILRLEHTVDRRRVRVVRRAALAPAPSYCWQCGQPLLQQVPSDAIGSRSGAAARAGRVSRTGR